MFIVANISFKKPDADGVVVRRIPKFGIRIPTNLLTIWKKILTNPDSSPNPKNRKKIRDF
jgi:hypothetical protein